MLRVSLEYRITTGFRRATIRVMTTITLSMLRTITKKIRPPAAVDMLLRELVMSARLVPEGGYQLGDRRSLTPELQRVSRYAEHAGHALGLLGG